MLEAIELVEHMQPRYRQRAIFKRCLIHIFSTNLKLIAYASLPCKYELRQQKILLKNLTNAFLNLNLFHNYQQHYNCSSQVELRNSWIQLYCSCTKCVSDERVCEVRGVSNQSSSGFSGGGPHGCNIFCIIIAKYKSINNISNLI